MNKLHLAGRILLGGFFLYTSITSLIDFKTTVAFAQAYKVPFPEPLTLIAMLLLFAAGFSFLTGFQPRLGTLTTILFLVPVSLMMHQFWKIQDPMLSLIQQKFFLENVGLLGSSLTFMVIPTPWPYSLDEWLQSKGATSDDASQLEQTI